MLLLAVATVIAVYLLLLGVLWAGQERVVFQPPNTPSRDLPSIVGGQPVRQVSYRAKDGTELRAFVVGDLSSLRGLLLAFHGNADLARNLIPWAAEVAERERVAVLLPELRGYDGLAGRPTYEGVAMDARAALQIARDSLRVPDAQLAYFGHSLGSAIATELASEHAPAVLILESPLSSARAMARRMSLPGMTLFWPFVSRVHYDTEGHVRRISVPVWVTHGDRDVIIPVRMGREVFAAAAVKGELLIVHGAGHNDVADRGGADYWQWLGRALAALRKA